MNIGSYSTLIVDHEDIVRRLLCDKLTHTGYQCTEAANAYQALSELQRSEFDLVLLDIDLPDIQEVELFTYIYRYCPNTAIVVATPYGNTSIGLQHVKLGASGYVTKPLILDEVVRVISTTLHERRLKLLEKDFQRQLQDKLIETTKELHSIFVHAISSLVYALEAKDKYTSGHSQEVAAISAAVAEEMGMPQKNIGKIYLAGLIHDIGKIGVSGSVLNKPGRLTDEEFRHMQSHSTIGEHILAPFIDEATLKLVRGHHEHCDGSGYPDHLGSNQMLLGARILMVADAYDAMVSDRPYRKAMSNEAALNELRRCSGNQFDPDVVAALCVLVQRNALNFQRKDTFEYEDVLSSYYTNIYETLPDPVQP